MRFLCLLALAAGLCHAQSTLLYRMDFSKAEFGRMPLGFRDLIGEDVSPAWGIDGRGYLRPLLKLRHNGWWKPDGASGPPVPKAIIYDGFLIYAGALANGQASNEIADGRVEAEFKKTPDEEVSLSLAARVRDDGDYYAVRFSGAYRIELLKVSHGVEKKLADYVTRARYGGNLMWRMEFGFSGAHLTGRIWDEQGTEQARVDAIDSEFRTGSVGLRATTFAAARTFSVGAASPFLPSLTESEIARRNGGTAGSMLHYTIVRPVASTESMNTPFARLADRYDVVVAGAGTGGWAAAVQAARLGARVLLVEESDWIGGQMSAAAVTTMDESGIYYQFPVRERGIYREFHESMVNYFYTLDKDPFRAYYAVPTQLEGGYGPKAVRAILYGFVAETRRRGGPGGSPTTLDLCLDTKVVGVRKAGNTIQGITLENTSTGQPPKKYVQSTVLVDATEYGDVLPLTGARYRVGTSTSDRLNLDAPLQDNTWTAVIREYPEGIPSRLRITDPPPGYAEVARRLSHYQLWGDQRWKSLAPDEVKPPLSYRVLFSWRGMADSLSPMTGMMTEMRHTLCGQNGGQQDYPATVAAVENKSARMASEIDGINRSLDTIYYLQKELGLPWSVAEDQGYDTPYNRRIMAQHGVRSDLLPIAVHLPQWPYVRESRRGIGIYTLRAADLARYQDAKLFPTSVAMGDYFMDLHHTGDALETDLDGPNYPKGGGPFQVPFEAFVPEAIDGLMFAEKNISQSRLVSGATRLQPVTMLTGQAVGAIAALAVRHHIEPRQVNPIEVQAALLAAGSTLIQRWYADVPWGTPIWRATQLLSLYGVMDRPGPITPRNGAPLRGKYRWGVAEPLSPADYSAAMMRLAELIGGRPVSLAGKQHGTRFEFALAAADVLIGEGRLH